MNICIIGGGAAGIAAAITASKCGGHVTLLDHMPRIAKKLLLTGSGKCNITNQDMNLNHFHGNEAFIREVFNKCPVSETLNFLNDCGIILKNRNGYYYPYSEQASSVVDAFRFALRDLGVFVKTEVSITSIDKDNKSGKYLIITTDEKMIFDKIIICTGSKAYSKTGSDGSGYNYAKLFGHSINKVLPALTYFNCEDNFFTSIAGIRTKGKAAVILDGNELISEEGEIQITKTGFSGIPVFNISYLAAKELNNHSKLVCSVDFMPDYSNDKLYDIVLERINNFPNRSNEELLTGILHKNLANCILKRCGISLHDTISRLSNKNIKSIINMIKHFESPIISVGGYENAQVCAGGVDTTNISAEMESMLSKGLYFAGEILDVNGDCGGYNLTWAFTTGIIAGRNSVI